MPDIWSNVGADFVPQSEDWLYQKGSQIHGPVPKEAIVQKLVSGDIDAKTMVAREGGEFHPIAQIAAFAPHLDDVKKALRKRGAKKARRVLALVVLMVGGVGAGVGFYFKREAERKRHEIERAQAAAELKRQEEAKKRGEILGSKVDLVALVSFDDTQLKVGGESKGRKPSRPGKTGGEDPEGDKGPAEFVQECKRGQAEIMGVLRKNLAKINFCVEDEKKRDAANLPPSISLSFVALPEGKVNDFEILDRHYRTGPMRNCMLKVFNLIRFDAVGGTNCPVTIPIKIGG